jgi:hypothetical protein
MNLICGFALASTASVRAVYKLEKGGVKFNDGLLQVTAHIQTCLIKDHNNCIPHNRMSGLTQEQTTRSNTLEMIIITIIVVTAVVPLVTAFSSRYFS